VLQISPEGLGAPPAEFDSGEAKSMSGTKAGVSLVQVIGWWGAGNI
jgi:hypothetical protein